MAWRFRFFLLPLIIAGLSTPANFAADTATAPWDQVTTKAIDFLRSTQAEDGSWSKDRSPGITGIILTGLLKSGKVGPYDPMAVRALSYIDSLVNAEDGHLAGKGARVQLKNYVTSVNVMALAAANREDRYKRVINDAAAFLKKLQWDEEEGKQPNDDYYGGAGYDSRSRPDLSNTQFFLEAMKDAGVPDDDPALKKALLFVSRCQNLKSEHNDQPWAGTINDGSFIYSSAAGGQTKVDDAVPPKMPGYGSMTYAGIKSMIYCGVTKDDPRIKRAYEWIQKHYTVEENPGMTPQAAQRGLYYYYHTMAKCLAVMDLKEVVDSQGKKHNWRADIVAALAKRQKSNGSWGNDREQWMEGDPNLVTGFALMALSYCKPQ